MKGQWFLISAVIAAGAFLTISVIFRSYFFADSSSIAKMDEDYYYWNLKAQLNKVLIISDCTNMEKNVNEAVYFFRQNMAEKGYMLYVNYSSIDCSGKKINNLGIVLASERMVIRENANVSRVIG
jgi:hypothetical protein